MDTLVTVVVVLAMIAIAAFVIHRLNVRHRHQHIRAAEYDHGLAGFGGFGGGSHAAGVRGGTTGPGRPAPGSTSLSRPADSGHPADGTLRDTGSTED